MITNVTARFMRRHQVAQYEPAEAEATIVAQVLDGGDADTIIAASMLKARGIVLGALGLAQSASREPGSGTVPSSALENQAGTAATATAPEKTKRGPGRPPKQPEAVEGAATGASEVKTEPTPAATAPAADKPADPAGMDDFEKTVAAATPVEPIKISEAELQRVAAETAQRLGSSAPVKEVMSKNYKIARLGELREDLRPAFVADLKGLKPAVKA